MSAIINTMSNPKLMSFFSGAFGLDIGLEEAGFDVIWANELEKDFANTIMLNRPKVKVSQGDITELDPKKVMKELGLKVGEIELFAGGPPCQSFSTAGRRLSINDARGNLMLHYIQWINIFKPKYFILENVKGLLSAPIKHTPHAQRGKDWKPTAEEARGSALRLVLSEIEKIGYTVNYKLLNTADYGVPQARERVIMLGSRDGDLLEFPQPTHSKSRENKLLPWVTLREAIGDLREEESEFTNYSETRLKYLRQVPMGGNWRSLPPEVQEAAMGGAYRSGGGKVGFYRRLNWDKPSPTVTTSPHQKATDMCHPVEDRPLTVREYARIQQFPDDWQFFGKTSQKYKQIGNAVPVGLGRVIGETVFQAIAAPKPAPFIEESPTLSQTSLMTA